VVDFDVQCAYSLTMIAVLREGQQPDE